MVFSKEFGAAIERIHEERMVLACLCAEWKPNIAKVNAPIALAFARNQKAIYTGVPFRYCPWCGSALIVFDCLSGESPDGTKL